MTIDDKIREEKFQDDINREAAKKKQKQHYHLGKLINLNILQVRNITA